MIEARAVSWQRAEHLSEANARGNREDVVRGATAAQARPRGGIARVWGANLTPPVARRVISAAISS